MSYSAFSSINHTPPMSPTHGDGGNSPTFVSPNRRRRQVMNSMPQDLQGGEENVQVCIRVRPFNRRELDIHQAQGKEQFIRSVVEMPEGLGGRVKLLGYNADTGEYHEAEEFQFTKTFWSIPESQQPHKYAPVTQEDVYNATGKIALHHALDGFNTCIFAYGQTGSGKTHTMMGDFTTSEGQWLGDPGMVPRFCKELFETVEQKRNESSQENPLITTEFDIKLSAIEIYNETVRDLFWRNTAGRTKSTILKVRVHPIDGAFVDQLTVLNPENWLDCIKLIAAGVSERTVAATLMNDESSRSHSLFSIIITQKETVRLPADHPEFRFQKPVTTTRIAHVNLVDLAGSERNKKSGAQGQQLKEAAGINQSLSTLKKVIDALVTNSKEPNKKKHVIVPYRESTLTHLLSHSLGGNSKTTMIACVSPHNDNFEETQLTLRYANRAKGIMNMVRVNDDDTSRQAALLRNQILELQNLLASGPADPEEVEALKDQIEVGQAALTEMHRQVQEASMKAEKMEERLSKEKESRYAAAFYNSFKMLYLQKAREEMEKRALKAEDEAKKLADKGKSLEERLYEVERQLSEERSASQSFKDSDEIARDKNQKLSKYAKELAHLVDKKQTRLNQELEQKVGHKWLTKHRTRKETMEHEEEISSMKASNEDYIRCVVEEAAAQYEALVRAYSDKEAELKENLRIEKDRNTALQVSFDALQQRLGASEYKYDEMQKVHNSKMEQKARDQENQRQGLKEIFDNQIAEVRKEITDVNETWKRRCEEERVQHARELAEIKETMAKERKEADVQHRIVLKELEDAKTLQLEKAMKYVELEHEGQMKEVHTNNRKIQNELQAQLKRNEELIEELRAAVRQAENKERRYNDLAHRIEDVLATRPPRGSSEDYLRLLDLLKNFVGQYRSVQPLAHTLRNVHQDTMNHHPTNPPVPYQQHSSSPSPVSTSHRSNVPSAAFYPLHQPNTHSSGGSSSGSILSPRATMIATRTASPSQHPMFVNLRNQRQLRTSSIGPK